MYCRAGQGTEEEMYNNEESGPALEEFLEMLGQRVRLKGFDRYKAGLDNKSELKSRVWREFKLLSSTIQCRRLLWCCSARTGPCSDWFHFNL